MASFPAPKVAKSSGSLGGEIFSSCSIGVRIRVGVVASFPAPMMYKRMGSLGGETWNSVFPGDLGMAPDDRVGVVSNWRRMVLFLVEYTTGKGSFSGRAS